MHTISNYIRRNLLSVLALLVALTGTSAYAANTVFSADIVNGEVATPDLAVTAATANKLGPDAVNSAKVLDDSLKGDDIQESSLALDFQGTAKVASKRVTFPEGTNGDLVLDVPGFGEVRTKTCSQKSARSSFFNDTAKTVDAFANISRIVVDTIDPLFAQLAPGEEIYGSEIEGKESATYQVGFGSQRVATIVVMSRADGLNGCTYQAQATID
jgi:hypothetical protein